MLAKLIGAPLTKPLLIGAAVIVAALLGVIGAQGVAIWWLNGQVDHERERYADMQAKNARCEAESSGLKGAVTSCNENTDAWKEEAKAAQAVSAAALEAARRGRAESDARINRILGAKPDFADDMCKSACALIEREVRK